MQINYADCLDQLDLALDQLCMNESNYHRFALMLIDNVVELVLHHHAEKRKLQKINSQKIRNTPTGYEKIIDEAIGRKFDKKVDLAKLDRILSDDQSISIKILHKLRNTSYHQGLLHEIIIHEVTKFYLKIACNILIPTTFSKYFTFGKLKFSTRAIKYLGTNNTVDFASAFKRILDVTTSFKDSLIEALCTSMANVIDETNEHLNVLERNWPETLSRDQIILECQTWHFAFTKNAANFAKRKKHENKDLGSFLAWLKTNYKWETKCDPIPAWRENLERLKAESNAHKALSTYHHFLENTSDLRDVIYSTVCTLEVRLEEDSDHLRDLRAAP